MYCCYCFSKDVTELGISVFDDHGRVVKSTKFRSPLGRTNEITNYLIGFGIMTYMAYDAVKYNEFFRTNFPDVWGLDNYTYDLRSLFLGAGDSSPRNITDVGLAALEDGARAMRILLLLDESKE